MPTIGKTSLIRNICVFCGSATGQNPAFGKMATELGQYLANYKIRLIYGGGDFGLMGTLAKATQANGGNVTGIIPEFLVKYQQGDFVADEQIVTKDMHTRKAEMYQRADAFIALPGGIGTLEELVETMTWSQLGTHQKPIFLFNSENFWQPFLTLLNDMRAEDFIRKGLEVNFNIIETIDQLKQHVDQLNSSVYQETDQNLAGDVKNLSRL